MSDGYSDMMRNTEIWQEKQRKAKEEQAQQASEMLSEARARGISFGKTEALQDLNDFLAGNTEGCDIEEEVMGELPGVIIDPMKPDGVREEPDYHAVPSPVPNGQDFTYKTAIDGSHIEMNDYNLERLKACIDSVHITSADVFELGANGMSIGKSLGKAHGMGLDINQVDSNTYELTVGASANVTIKSPSGDIITVIKSGKRVR